MVLLVDGAGSREAEETTSVSPRLIPREEMGRVGTSYIGRSILVSDLVQSWDDAYCQGGRRIPRPDLILGALEDVCDLNEISVDSRSCKFGGICVHACLMSEPQ